MRCVPLPRVYLTGWSKRKGGSVRTVVASEFYFERSFEDLALGDPSILCTFRIVSAYPHLLFRTYSSLGQWNMAALSDTLRDADAGKFIPAPRAHMFLLVQVNSSPGTYVVDAGGGPFGPVNPILLQDGEVSMGSAPPEEFRVTRLHCEDPGNSLPWAMEMRCGEYMPEWRTLFRFGNEPAAPSEIETMNLMLTQRKESKTFWNDVFCVSYFVVDEGSTTSSGSCVEKGLSLTSPDKNMGKLVLTGGKVTRRIGDKLELVTEVKTELDRISVLRSLFGVKLEEDDILHMEGRVPELPHGKASSFMTRNQGVKCWLNVAFLRFTFELTDANVWSYRKPASHYCQYCIKRPNLSLLSLGLTLRISEWICHPIRIMLPIKIQYFNTSGLDDLNRTMYYNSMIIAVGGIPTFSGIDHPDSRLRL